MQENRDISSPLIVGTLSTIANAMSKYSTKKSIFETKINKPVDKYGKVVAGPNYPERVRFWGPILLFIGSIVVNALHVPSMMRSLKKNGAALTACMVLFFGIVLSTTTDILVFNEPSKGIRVFIGACNFACGIGFIGYEKYLHEKMAARLAADSEFNSEADDDLDATNAKFREEFKSNKSELETNSETTTTTGDEYSSMNE